MRYPHAEWVPWKPGSADGHPTFYAGQNRPAAVVLHVMQGYQRVARQWAESGMYPKSWHYSVARDGRVMQHLGHADGGYHAGITAAKALAHPPAWPLWRGPAVNVNHYTIGIEHEGFAGEQFTLVQAQASRRFCRWLARELGIPLDRDHFPAHAVIDPRDRPHDFNTPPLRDYFYAFLFAPEEDEPMTTEERARLERLERIAGGNGIDVAGPNRKERLRGDAALAWLDAQGISLPLAVHRLNDALLALAPPPSPAVDDASTSRAPIAPTPR